jgi:hypothetical protein
MQQAGHFILTHTSVPWWYKQETITDVAENFKIKSRNKQIKTQSLGTNFVYVKLWKLVLKAFIAAMSRISLCETLVKPPPVSRQPHLRKGGNTRK